jgi:hypothetical protein
MNSPRVPHIDSVQFVANSKKAAIRTDLDVLLDVAIDEASLLLR